MEKIFTDPSSAVILYCNCSLFGLGAIQASSSDNEQKGVACAPVPFPFPKASKLFLTLHTAGEVIPDAFAPIVSFVTDRVKLLKIIFTVRRAANCCGV